MEAKVLIVDDSKTIRFRVRQYLEQADDSQFEVVEMDDGESALRFLCACPIVQLPDVIILDRNMPNMSGDECIQVLKVDDSWCHIPVLFLTAQSDISELVKGLSELKADDYLPKPFDSEELIARVKALVRVKQAEDEIRKLNLDLEENLMLQERAYKELETTKVKLGDANNSIMSSIQYAKMIQSSLLPNPEEISKSLPDSFIVWEPRDVVGGDIFFADFVDGSVTLAVVDCTGHGVPGAFMTMITVSGLQRVIVEDGCHDPCEILSRLNFMVKTTLHQDTGYAVSNDGLDAAICHVDIDNMILTYAGARLPLLCLSDDKVTHVKGDRQSIGYRKSDLTFQFTNHVLKITKDTAYYMFTDGFIDQLGGERGFSFGKKRFERLLQQNYRKPFEEQRDLIVNAFDEYQGDNERIDDVTVVGFGRLSDSNRPSDGR